MPKGYWISAHRRPPDPEKYDAYRVIAKPAVELAGGKFLVVDGNPDVREFGEQYRTVVIEFPSKEAAIQAYESEAYQRAWPQSAMAMSGIFGSLKELTGRTASGPHGVTGTLD
jgi:uncharacterized protein (DUF1330 family)